MDSGTPAWYDKEGMLLPDDQLQSLLLQSNLIDAAKIDEVLGHAKASGASLTNELIDQGIVTDEQIGQLVAGYFKIPFVVLSKVSIPEDVFHIIPEKIARKHKAVAFSREPDGVHVAMTEPRSSDLLDMVVKKTNQKVSVYYATDKDFENTLQIYKKVLQKTIDELLKEDIKKATTLISDELPIAKIVDVLIDASYQDKSSDVHIEPEENNSLIRFRIDGVLHDVLRVPKALHDRIMTRIKVLSSLRTDEHLSAQDGKMRMALEEEQLDIRVSILPVSEGEKAVLRLLSSNSREHSLSDLGMNEGDLKKVNKAYDKSYGMILSP